MEKLIIDSDIGLKESLVGLEIPEDIQKNLTLINVRYISFDNLIHQGQLVVHSDIALNLKEIFNELLELKFPIEKVIPLVKYNWSDDKSMEDNNSSAFNYRVIYGTDRLSNHSYGRAIDINPKLNPYIPVDGNTFPKGATYNPNIPGTIIDNSEIIKAFISRGFEWGGNWTSLKDWQHFEKTK